MGFAFNADEVFGMAEQIERNGSKFYRYAAERAGDAALRQRLIGLSEWELRHEKRFHEMRTQLTEADRQPTAYDPEGENSMFVQTMADGHVFDISADPTERLKGTESIPELLRIAIGIEKDSIVFYLGMKGLIPSRESKEKIDDIIREEMGHIAVLSSQLSMLGQAER